jgi:hypothetical protein
MTHNNCDIDVLNVRFRESLPFNVHLLDVVFAAAPDVPDLQSVLRLVAKKLPFLQTKTAALCELSRHKFGDISLIESVAHAYGCCEETRVYILAKYPLY